MEERPITSPEFIDGFNREKIEPWQSIIHFDKITLESDALGDIQMVTTLNLLQRYGICILRLHGQAPTEETFRAYFDSLGQVTDEQNLYKGIIKNIKLDPDADIAPITGSSPGDLGYHIDGTQTPDQPALLAFQYVEPADVGGNSRFVDLAAVLFGLPTDVFVRLLTNLSHSDTATFRKSGMTLTSPIFHLPDGESLACRIRLDDVISVKDQYKEDFEVFKAAIEREDFGIKFKPRAGDIIVFDNWRVLHARDTVLGYNQRHHRRVWMEALLPRHQPYYKLGLRPIAARLKATIEENNAMARDDE